MESDAASSSAAPIMMLLLLRTTKLPGWGPQVGHATSPMASRMTTGSSSQLQTSIMLFSGSWKKTWAEGDSGRSSEEVTRRKRVNKIWASQL